MTNPKRLQTLKPQVRMLGERRSSTQRGYNYRWQRYREAWLVLHPLCGDRVSGPNAEHSECRRTNRVTAATDVDHIKRVSGATDPLFWESANHQSLCHACHSIKTQLESGGTARRTDVAADGWPVARSEGPGGRAKS